MPRDRERDRRRVVQKEPVGELRIAKEDERLFVRPVSDIEELKKILGENVKACPNCGSQTEIACFCNYCGAPFCPACSESSKEGTFRVFACPKCSKRNYIK